MPDLFDCPICYGEVSGDDVTTVPDCGHTFCNRCWNSMLPVEITKHREGDIAHISCPGVVGSQGRCKVQLDLHWVYDFLGMEMPADLKSRADHVAARRSQSNVDPKLAALYQKIDQAQQLAFLISQGIKEPSGLEDLSYIDEDGRTLLHWACNHEKPKIIELLLGLGANLDAADHHGQTALHVACQAGSPIAVELLLNASASSNAKDKSERTPLYYAVRIGSDGIVTKLLEAGAQVSADSFVAAALHNRGGLVKILREAVATTASGSEALSAVANTKILGRTALQWAAHTRSPNASVELLEMDGDIELVDDINGHTALQIAAAEGARLVVNQLLEASADAFAKTEQGHSPLSLAAHNGNVHAVKVILEHLQQMVAQANSVSDSEENSNNPALVDLLDVAIRSAENQRHSDALINIQNAKKQFLKTSEDDKVKAKEETQEEEKII